MAKTPERKVMRIRKGRAFLTAGAVALASLAVRASTTTIFGESFEAPLQTLQTSLQGPVVLAIAMIAMAITGGVLIFGGELSNLGKRASYVVLVLGVLLTANTLVQVLFTSATATIFYT